MIQVQANFSQILYECYYGIRSKHPRNITILKQFDGSIPDVLCCGEGKDCGEEQIEGDCGEVGDQKIPTKSYDSERNDSETQQFRI